MTQHKVADLVTSASHDTARLIEEAYERGYAHGVRDLEGLNRTVQLSYDDKGLRADRASGSANRGGPMKLDLDLDDPASRRPWTV